MTQRFLPLDVQGDIAAGMRIDSDLPQTPVQVRQTIYGAIASLRLQDREAALDGLYWFASQDFARAAEAVGAEDNETAYDAFIDRMVKEATE